MASAEPRGAGWAVTPVLGGPLADRKGVEAAAWLLAGITLQRRRWDLRKMKAYLTKPLHWKEQV